MNTVHHVKSEKRMKQPTRKTGKAGGRPARLTREQILDTAMALLREAGGQEL